MQPEYVDTVVLGGGISGLCVAHRLRQRGRNVLLLEKDNEAGGTMKSRLENGFLSELGPNSALETTPLIGTLVSELGLSDEFVYANPEGKNRFILKGGELHALPLSPASFVATRLFSLSAKLRLLKEPFIGRASRDESIAEFVTRRLGKEFLDYAIDPFVAGVYAARPDSLSVRSAFPKLFALEETYGGLIRGMIFGRKERAARTEKAKDRARSFSFRSGMQTLPRRIAQELGPSIRCSAEAIAVQQTGQGLYEVQYRYEGGHRILHTASVVFAIPAGPCSSLVQRLSSAVSVALRSIPYPPVTSVYLGFNREHVGHPMNGFGFLVPSRERAHILGCLWSSSLFPGRAPDGRVAVTVFVGGSRQPDLAGIKDDGLLTLVLRDLESIMQIRGKPVYWTINRWAHAIPQYDLEHRDRMATLDELERTSAGIFFCSNFRGGIAVGDCIQNAEATAVRVHEHLDRQRTV